MNTSNQSVIWIKSDTHNLFFVVFATTIVAALDSIDKQEIYKTFLAFCYGGLMAHWMNWMWDWMNRMNKNSDRSAAQEKPALEKGLRLVKK